MKAKLAAAVIATSLAVFGTIFSLATSTVAGQSLGTTNTTTSSNMTTGGSNMSDTMTSGYMGDHMSAMGLNDTGKMFGPISSIQNDEDGEPAWIVTGHWMIINETGTTNITDFRAGFYMITLEGTNEHTHEISNFTQTANSTTEGNVTTITGTTTVTMREGPVHDVETEIMISEGKVIEISLDPEALDNHFGNTPIYGIVITPEILQHIMNMTKTSSTGNMTGMMGGDHGWRGNETGTAPAGEMR